MWEREYDEQCLRMEIYRQNYEDALDEIRNLKFRIAELEQQINDRTETTDLEEYYYGTFYQPIRNF